MNSLYDLTLRFLFTFTIYVLSMYSLYVLSYIKQIFYYPYCFDFYMVIRLVLLSSRIFVTAVTYKPAHRNTYTPTQI